MVFETFNSNIRFSFEIQQSKKRKKEKKKSPFFLSAPPTIAGKSCPQKRDARRNMGCGSSSANRHHIIHAAEPKQKEQRKPQPSPPPPSILRELFNDIAANVAGAVDQEGKATAKGLVALIQEVGTISGTPFDDLPKPSQVDEVSKYNEYNVPFFIRPSFY